MIQPPDIGAHRFAHQAMATEFEILCAHPNREYAQQAAWAAFDLLDNTPQFVALPFTGITAKWDDAQTAFMNTYAAKTIVYQDAVNYVNPQWMDIGKDMVAMFTGKETPAQVMKAIDTRRTQEAKAAKDPAWQ